MSDIKELFKEPVSKEHKKSVLTAMEKEMPESSSLLERFFKFSPAIAAAVVFLLVLWLRPGQEDGAAVDPEDLALAQFMDPDIVDDFEMFADDDMEIVELLLDEDLEVNI